ncbi:hypothetical protein [Methanospirillum sp.]
MTSNDRGPSSRVAICEAQRLLIEKGYNADRISSGDRLYDIVAWQNGHVLLVSVKASRQLERSNYREHITALSGMLRDQPDHYRTAEMWIYSRSHWFQWEITPGGAIQKREVAS